MVKSFSFFRIVFCIFIWLEATHTTKSHASNSFAVSTTFGVQPNQHPQSQNATRKLQAFNIQEFRPSPRLTRFYSINCATTQSPRRRAFIAETNTKNISQLVQASQTNSVITEPKEDFKKPSIQNLQRVISGIVKKPSEIHQMVKVPAVYEMHLQEEVEPWKFNSLRQAFWRNPHSKYLILPRNKEYNRPVRAYPSPFKRTKVSTYPAYDRKIVAYPHPDLRWYYAKKNEPLNTSRRKTTGHQLPIRRNGGSFFPFLDGLNYIIRIRERTNPDDRKK